MALSLQEISDRLEINDLLVDYCEAVDTVNIDAFDNIFTTDATIDYSAFGFPQTSYQETKDFLKGALKQVPCKQHIIANSRLWIEGDTARGKTLCLNPMTVPNEESPLQMTHYGLWYLDKFVRTAEGWRICERIEEKSYTYTFAGELS